MERKGRNPAAAFPRTRPRFPACVSQHVFSHPRKRCSKRSTKFRGKLVLLHPHPTCILPQLYQTPNTQPIAKSLPYLLASYVIISPSPAVKQIGSPFAELLSPYIADYSLHLSNPHLIVGMANPALRRQVINIYKGLRCSFPSFCFAPVPPPTSSF